MKKVVGLFWAFWLALTLGAFAQGAPEQWSYSTPGGVPQASYPGQVSIPQLGTQNCIGATSGLLGPGACSGAINVQLLGAKCDGSTDNSAALQTAIAQAESTGAAIYIPGCAGTYNFGTTLVINGVAGVAVYGDGPSNSKLEYTGTTTGISVDPATLTGPYLYFSNFRITSSAVTTSATLLSIVNATQTFLVRMEIDHQYNCVHFGNNTFSARVISSVFLYCGATDLSGGNAVSFSPGSNANNAIILSNRIASGAYGIYVPDGNNIAINYNDIEGMAFGIYLHGVAATGTLSSVDISDNYIENANSTSGDDMYIDPGGPSAATSITVANNWLGASVAMNWTAQNLDISNNTLYNNSLFIAAGSSGRVSGMLLAGTATFSASSGVLSIFFSPTVVASLPSASVYKGSSGAVTDATACTSGSAVTGGGAITCSVYSNGTNWIH